MFRKGRMIIYVVLGVSLLFAALAAPAAWATPSQNALAQTVPTATPTSAPPVNPPPAQPTTAPAQATPAPAASPLAVTLVVDQRQAIPGATLTFTATLTNNGAAPLEGVTFEHELPAGLEPGAVLSGPATWQDRTLVLAPVTLGAGEQLELVYQVLVGTLAPGQALVIRVDAAAGSVTANASVTLALPPSELPTTGGQLD